MGITFFESMSGELLDAAGQKHSVVFDLRCEASHLAHFLIDGRARLTGTIQALPWTEGAYCEGSLLVRPLLERKLEYDLAFAADDGAWCRLHGHKTLSLLRPVESMTVMPTRLEREGELLAQGQLRFELSDLPEFLRSWSLDSALRPADFSAFADGLSQAERATLAAFAETVLTPGRLVPAADSRTLDRTCAILPHLPPVLLSALRAGLQSIDAAARLRFGGRFAELPPSRRLSLIEGLGSLGTLPRAAVLALGMPLKTAHFSRRDYLDAVGLPDYKNPTNEARPGWMSSVFEPETMPELTDAECDVVVIGTGAGGAALAATLAERGLGVALLEEGRYHGRPQFAGGPEERLLKFWRDGGMNLAVGNLAIAVPVGRMVGGSTAINSGTCFRTPDSVLAEWRRAGFPADFEPDRFGEWLDRVEAELEVAEADARYLGRIAKVVAAGAEQLGGRHGPLRRNASGCDGQGLCAVGCPTDARRSANVSWVPRAMRAGAALYTGLPATRLLLHGGRALGVEASGQDRFGAPKRLMIRARAVVVACGALHSPLLLRQSGIRLPWLGRNLSIHPALGAFALFDEDMDSPWRAIPQSYFVEGLVDERVRFEGFYAPPQLAAASLPFDGPELTRWMDEWRRVGQFGFMVRDAGVGSVTPGFDGRPLLWYSVTPEVLELFRRGSAVLAEMLLRGGAREVATGIEGVGTVSSLEQARSIAGMRLKARQFRAMGFHPLGTCRMGGSADGSVVDFRNRVHGTRGLYVVDGSSVPSSLGVNPQVTIMAMALRAADLLAEELG